MEADWAVEIGPGLPVIDALWPGYIDLAATPDRIGEIQEAIQCPSLAQALLQINQSNTDPVSGDSGGFWTTKCDLWEPDNWDPYEMDASEEQAQAAIACYIDILPRSAGAHACFRQWQNAEQCARELAVAIRKRELAAARIDCIVRSCIAQSTDARTQEGFGITLYLTSCGADQEAASRTLSAALQIATESLTVMHHSPTNLLPLQ